MATKKAAPAKAPAVDPAPVQAAPAAPVEEPVTDHSVEVAQAAELTDEELGRPPVVDPTPAPTGSVPDVNNGAAILAAALVQAIDTARGPVKKNAFNRKEGTPWTPKAGEPKHKLTRKMYQHSILIDPDMCTNERIDLLNQLQPGSYCGGYLKVHKRRDWGIDIDYPIRTTTQRLRLVNQFGIKDFNDMLRTCIEEHKTKKQAATPEYDEV